MRPSPPTHPASQPSPHPQPPTPHSQMMPGQVQQSLTWNQLFHSCYILPSLLLLQPFMGPRYPGGPRPGVRMPQMGPEFGGVSSLHHFIDNNQLILQMICYSLLVLVVWCLTVWIPRGKVTWKLTRYNNAIKITLLLSYSFSCFICNNNANYFIDPLYASHSSKIPFYIFELRLRWRRVRRLARYRWFKFCIFACIVHLFSVSQFQSMCCFF